PVPPPARIGQRTKESAKRQCAKRFSHEMIPSGVSYHHHCILQHAYPANLDFDDISRLQRYTVWRHDAGAAQHDRTVRKLLAAEDKTWHFLEPAFDLVHRCLAGKRTFLAAPDFEPNAPFPRCFLAGAEMDPGTQRA